MKDGFKILLNIIVNGSPQLGGEDRDLGDYVNTLNINDGEKLVEFYIRTERMKQEIYLQKDTSGQDKKLVQRFLLLLVKVPQYKM